MNFKFSLMRELSKVSKKGLTTIPAKIKNALGVEEGDYLEWSVIGDKAVVRVVKNPYKFLKGRHDDPGLTYEAVEGEADNILGREAGAGNRA
jgi:AbrB family looped-hinge helix DNA binding protein